LTTICKARKRKMMRRRKRSKKELPRKELQIAS
jgi:hypothetical protein